MIHAQNLKQEDVHYYNLIPPDHQAQVHIQG
jgi:hypothetical protein